MKMNTLILEPTVTAEWKTLVKEAEEANHYSLSEDLESYLVFLLARFTSQPEIANSVLALDFLRSLEHTGQQRTEALREVGDKSLLFAGLFPNRANRRRVKISYFVDIGRNAYSALATLSKKTTSELYIALDDGFVTLMDVLHVMRELANQNAALTPLQAAELWHDTHSRHALAVLRRTTQAMAV
jgi:hypothetical protein